MNEPFVTEQLGFQQGLGEGGAVDCDERLSAPARIAVDGPGHQLLPGPALPGEEHGRVHRGDEVDALEDVPDLPRASDDAGLELDSVAIELLGQDDLDLIGIGRGRQTGIQVVLGGQRREAILGRRHDREQRGAGNELVQSPAHRPRALAARSRRQHEGDLLLPLAAPVIELAGGLDHLDLVSVGLDRLADGDRRLELSGVDEHASHVCLVL